MNKEAKKKDNESDTNFEVIVRSLIEIYNGENKKTDTQVKLVIEFEDGVKSDEFTVSLSELDTFDWVKHDFRCKLPCVNPTKAKREVANKIRDNLSKTKVEKLYLIDKMGLHFVEGEAVFCTGSEIIRSQPLKLNSPSIKRGNLPYNLKYNPNISKSDAIVGMLNLAGLSSHAGRPILVYNVMWIMRAAYAAAWKQPRFCFFGYADTSSLKTSFITTISYSGDVKNPPQLNSTLAAATDIIKSKRDCITVFDDLRPAKDAMVRQKLQSLLIEITRGIADETFAAKMRGNEVVQIIPASGVIFTGEYEYGEGSDAARLFLVNVKSVDERGLKLFQQNPEIVGSFYHEFIKWYLYKYNEITEYLKEWWYDYYSEYDFGVLRRLRETLYYLNTSHMLLMEFCIESGVVSKEKAKIYQKSFSETITDLIREQDKRARPRNTEESTDTNYLSVIRVLYKAQKLNLASSSKTFAKNHVGFTHDNCLCLYSVWLNNAVTRKTFFNGASIDDICGSLEKQNALRRSKDDKRTTQINCNKKTPRFYKIPLAKL